jgi:hypothetical protein
MANPIGQGNKFQPANGQLERKVFQMGGPQMTNGDVRGGGNIPVAPSMGDVPYASIGKGQEGVRGASPIKVMGMGAPFGPAAETPGMGRSFQPAPQPAPVPQPSPALGAGDEVHTLVARLKGPSGREYEAVYEVVVPERGSTVLGVTERPAR